MQTKLFRPYKLNFVLKVDLFSIFNSLLEQFHSKQKVLECSQCYLSQNTVPIITKHVMHYFAPPTALYSRKTSHKYDLIVKLWFIFLTYVFWYNEYTFLFFIFFHQKLKTSNSLVNKISQINRCVGTNHHYEKSGSGSSIGKKIKFHFGGWIKQTIF